MLKQIALLAVTGKVEPLPRQKTSALLRLVWLSLLVNAIFTIIDLVLTNYGLMERRSHPLTTLIEEEQIFWHVLVLFCFGAITDPLFEELSFRLSLSRKKQDTAIGLSFFLASVLVLFTNIASLIRPFVWFLARPVTILLISGLVYLVTYPAFRHQSFWGQSGDPKRSLRHWLLASAILFSLFHIKVSPTTDYWFLYPLTYGGFFVHAYIFAFARLNLGFWYAVLCHGAYNGLLFMLTIVRK